MKITFPEGLICLGVAAAGFWSILGRAIKENGGSTEAPWQPAFTAPPASGIRPPPSGWKPDLALPGKLAAAKNRAATAQEAEQQSLAELMTGSLVKEAGIGPAETGDLLKWTAADAQRILTDIKKRASEPVKTELDKLLAAVKDNPALELHPDDASLVKRVLPRGNEPFFVDSSSGRIDFLPVPLNGGRSIWISKNEIQNPGVDLTFVADQVPLHRTLPCRTPNLAEWLAAAKVSEILEISDKYGEFIWDEDLKVNLVIGPATTPTGLKSLSPEEWNTPLPKEERIEKTKGEPEFSDEKVTAVAQAIAKADGISPAAWRDEDTRKNLKKRARERLQAGSPGASESTFRYRWVIDFPLPENTP
jgi:hypothetical protein